MQGRGGNSKEMKVCPGEHREIAARAAKGRSPRDAGTESREFEKVENIKNKVGG